MKDPEFVTLRNRFLISILIVIIFASTLIAFMIRMLSNTDTVYRKIVKGDTMYILLVSKKCNRCQAVQDVLDENEISYYVLDNNSNSIKNIYSKIEMEDDIKVPCLLHIEKGKLDSYIDDIDDKTLLEEFINR